MVSKIVLIILNFILYNVLERNILVDHNCKVQL